MVRDHERACACIHGASRIFARVDALDHDRPAPPIANPVEVPPRHRRLLERRGDVGVEHWPFWQHDVRERHQPAVRDELREPPRPRDELSDVRQHGPRPASEELLRAVPEIAFPQSGDRGVDRDDERGEAGIARAADRAGRDVASSAQIDLVPGVTLCRFLDVLEAAPRER